MIREIKFRSWSKKTRRMSNPYGIHNHPNFNSEYKGKFCITTLPPASWLSNGLSENESQIALQYTGLKDKNGVEIYEGDIVVQYEIPNHPYDIKQQIFFADGMFCVGRIGDTQTPLNMEVNHCWHRGKKVNLIEVIGNIYENPELLEDY